MRIVLVKPAAEFSVSDVARGFHGAFAAAGHDVRLFDLSKRMIYHMRAMGEAWRGQTDAVSQQATEMVVVEAMKHRADLVVIVSALVFHPLGLVLLRQAGIPTAVILTESPYDDVEQADWAAAYPEATICTHERVSAARYGWLYLPHAYDPAIHRPVAPTRPPCDVLLLGTGWAERIALLEAVDWHGIDLRLLGLWPVLTEASPLWRHYEAGCLDNADAPGIYASARICLNLHRAHPDAESLNPRAYELAACGAFTVTDRRAEGEALFGWSQPMFTSAAQLAHVLREALADADFREVCAAEAHRRVQGETFEARAAALLAAMQKPAAVAAS
jgi:spore maturation protein CgeB